MTEFSIPADDWRFAIAMVLVCIPFMILVFLLQTRICAVLLRRAASWVTRKFTYGLAWVRAGSDAGAGDRDNWSTAPTAVRMGRKRRLMAMEGEKKESSTWPWDAWLGGRDGREERGDGRV